MARAADSALTTLASRAAVAVDSGCAGPADPAGATGPAVTGVAPGVGAARTTLTALATATGRAACFDILTAIAAGTPDPAVAGQTAVATLAAAPPDAAAAVADLIAEPIPVRFSDAAAKASGAASTKDDICGSDH